jgi:DNA-binding PadR family transcriptional regulator
LSRTEKNEAILFSKKRRKAKDRGLGVSGFIRPQGAPRGLLVHYMLHTIAQKPTHGYEILQDIDEKTDGAWRPGPGSVYPILKKLLSEGYIKAERTSGLAAAHRVYHVTPKGLELLGEGKKFFANVAQRWSSMRRLFVNLIDVEDFEKFFINGSRLNFQVAQEMLESKIDKLSPSELEYALKEYALNLERQLAWTNEKLKQLTGKSASVELQHVEKMKKHEIK